MNSSRADPVAAQAPAMVQAGRTLPDHAVSPGARVAMAVFAAAAFATCYWPAPLLRAWVRGLAGNPRYAGLWLVVEHLLLYTTLSALLCMGLWVLLARGGRLPPPAPWLSWGPSARSTWAWGCGSGLALAVANVGLMLLFNRVGLLPGRWELAFSPPDEWRLLGNVFSNFYEELIYRGFLLAVASTVLRGTVPGVVATSLLFGLTHEQYPLLLQLVLAGSGAGMAWAALRTGSLWAAWLSHEVFDLVLDSVWA